MEHTSQVIFDKNSIEFVTVAAEYCGFIERSRGAERNAFVDTALKILPLLYLKATLIPECEMIGEDDLEVFVTEDDYECVQYAIAQVLGPQDDYLEVFHPDMPYSDTHFTFQARELSVGTKKVSHIGIRNFNYDPETYVKNKRKDPKVPFKDLRYYKYDAVIQRRRGCCQPHSY